MCKKIIKERNFQRIVIGSDLHCGHRVGLTPPQWRSNPSDKYYESQLEMWEEWQKALSLLQPIDYFFGNGDLIDGDGGRSGATELIQPDSQVQAEMAVECIKVAKAKKHAFVYGTPYHTGQVEDFENDIAKAFDAPISGQEQYNVNGVIIDCKHKIGNTSIPHGKGTAIMKEALWNMVWAEYEEQEKADIIVRSHVHWYLKVEDTNFTGIVTPALQGQGTKYGSRQCSGHVDWGFIWIDIYSDGGFECLKHVIPLRSQKRKAVVL